jgi:hypothetical protein
MEVVRITKKVADEWVRKKHYSRRPSIFWAGFALVIEGKIEGVVIYGQPSPPIQRYAFKDRDFRLYELSRLVIQTDRKNAASFLIGNSLKMLEKPCAIISYADSNYNHCGYVYQATNWIYTGATKSHDCLYLVDGEKLHSMTVRDRFKVTKPKQWAKENNIETIKPKDKHRYFYICAPKKLKKKMLSQLKYDIIEEYPKIEPSRYDDGEKIDMGVEDGQ